MRSKLWIFSLVLIVVVFAVEYDLAQRYFKNKPMAAQNLKTQLPSEKNNINHLPDASAAAGSVKVEAEDQKSRRANSESDLQNFETQFKLESQNISQLQSEPQKTEERLQALANKMTQEQMQKLTQLISDQSKDGDERAMAIEMLSRRKDSESLKALEDFVAQSDDVGAWSRSHEFESVLRAQAIEGIATYPEQKEALSALNKLSKKVNESFLRDRILRSQAGLKGLAPSIENQDNEALRKLVE